MKRARITSRDVARMAGVSTTTVSMVVHGSPLVKTSTRLHVQEIIDRLGYQTHAAAAALRSARSSTLGYIVPQVIEAVNDVFRHQILSAVTTRAEQAHYQIMLDTFLSAQHHTALFNSGRIDGALVDWASGDDTVQELLARNIPFVLVGREFENSAVNSVKADEYSGAYEATRHLIALGHKRIAVITGALVGEGSIIAHERLAGFQRALSEANLTCDPANVVYGDWRYASGYSLGMQLLSSSPRPTAIFGLSELIAVGVLKAAHKRGLRVPEDLSIITTEDTPWVEYISPELTAVHIPMYDVGIKATEILLDLLKQEASDEDELTEPVTRPAQQIILPTTLVVRESTAPPSTIE